ncbi:MAG TPA: class I SAM-dependent methyltransferase [Candidatus Limnocylindrales bacterium]|nr:class I SAM-dependent methyltransferase [Candidatus Limnocylindrales bacterium]
MPSTPTPDPKESVRQDWLAAAPFWKKWYSQLAFQSRQATELVVQGAAISPGMHVLDLASGSGEPALSLSAAVGPEGRVTATDLIREMLEIAEENAVARNLKNIDFRAADAAQLPFPAGLFDRVTCRFGIMFVPDIHKALTEIRRVLKPGGRVSFITWGSLEENPLFSTMLRPFLKYVDVPPPPPDSPQVFRFADENKLAATISAAGFQDVRVAKHKINWAWPGTPEQAWQGGSELAAPFKRIIAATSPDKRELAIHEAIEGYRHFYDGQSVNIPATINSATATTP